VAALPTLDWLLDVSGEVFGLRFVPVKVPVWHDDVIYVDVLDREWAGSTSELWCSVGGKSWTTGYELLAPAGRLVASSNTATPATRRSKTCCRLDANSQ